MTVPPNRVFHPAEGALLDLESLLALAQAPSRLLSAWAELSFGAQGGGLVLSGLEIEGTLADLASPGRALGAAASPGVVRAKLRDDRKVTLSPGVALVWTREGQHQLVRVPEPLPIPTLTSDKLAQRPVLVLTASAETEPAESMPAGLCARAALQPKARYVPEAGLQPVYLPLAMPLPDGVSWAHDLRRVWSPGHPALDALILRLDALQRRVWEVKQRGSVWDSHSYGEDWTRYQTIATAAIQAAIQRLGTGPTHTDERLRALELLTRSLRRSVEEVGNELLQTLGGAEAAGPYAELRDRLQREGR